MSHPTTETLENVPTIKAYNNLDFLGSPNARHIRIMCELQEPMKRLSDCQVDNYFLFVGSNSVRHPDDRRKQLEDLEEKVKNGADGVDELEQAKKTAPMDRYYVIAMELSEKIARWSQDRKSRGLPSFHVATGGGPGIMEAANRGASQVGEVTIGFGSTRAEWGHLNRFVSQEAAFEFHYFFMRKFWMAYKCMGIVAFPGGFGTFDEVFELLALLVSKKIKHRLPVILLGRDHWTKVLNIPYLEECGMLTKEHVALIQIADSADEVFEYMTKQVEDADVAGENETGLVEQAKRRRLQKTSSIASAKHGDS